MGENWINWFFGIFTSFIAVFYKRLSIRVKTEIEEQNTLKLGLQALLRDRIIQAYYCYMGKGYYPIYARENVNALYTQYHNLGCNGTITDLIEALNKLPYEEKEVKE